MKTQKLDAAGAIALARGHPERLGRAVGFTKLNAMHGAWIRDMVFGTGDRTLQAHRGAYKTSCVSVALALLMLLRPEEKILFMRKTDNDVKEVIAQVRKILLHPVMQAFAGALYARRVRFTQAAATQLNTDLSNAVRGTAQLVGMGIGSSLTGKHFDRIFTDDIVNIQDRVSRAEREYTKLVYQELRNILNRGGRIYNTGTPWHEEDCFTLMPPPEKWTCYDTGLIDEAALSLIRAGMLPSLFAANYELRHIAAEDCIFTDPALGADPALLTGGGALAHVDAAYGGEDGTALTVCKRQEDGRFVVTGRLWQRHVGEVLPEIAEICNTFGVRRVYCETNADKGYLAKELRAAGLKTAAYHESMNKHLKITTYLLQAWRQITFTRDTDAGYLAQITAYTESAPHDDAPDSLASLVRAMERRGSGRYEPVLLKSGE